MKRLLAGQHGDPASDGITVEATERHELEVREASSADGFTGARDEFAGADAGKPRTGRLAITGTSRRKVEAGGLKLPLPLAAPSSDLLRKRTHMKIVATIAKTIKMINAPTATVAGMAARRRLILDTVFTGDCLCCAATGSKRAAVDLLWTWKD